MSYIHHLMPVKDDKLDMHAKATNPLNNHVIHATKQNTKT